MEWLWAGGGWGHSRRTSADLTRALDSKCTGHRQGALLLELGQLEFPASDFGAIWVLGEERIKQALERHLEPLQVQIKVYTVNDDQMVRVSVVPISAAFMLARFTPWVWIAGAFRKLNPTFRVNSARIAGEDYDATMMRMIPGPPSHAAW
jgi:hypothetical protein